MGLLLCQMINISEPDSNHNKKNVHNCRKIHHELYTTSSDDVD